MSEVKSTQIKRLYQSGKEFVPITLAEAVVVNATNVPTLSTLGITTLDKVLRVTLGEVEGISTNVTEISTKLNDAVVDINKKLENKQDKLTAGQGITIAPDADGNLVISTNISFEIYKLVDKLPEAPSLQYANTIYLVPTTGVSGEKDILEEYLCIKQADGSYAWERLGRIQPETGVDLSAYVTKEEFEERLKQITDYLPSTITASDVTTSSGASVIVTYEIPADLYDSVVTPDDGDQITT